MIVLATCLAQMSGRKHTRSLIRLAHRTWRQLIKQAERTVLADLQTPLSIAKLCGTLGVSERYLRKAYQMVHGMPPHQYLRMLKLSRARRALMSARSRSVTVTKIATRLGFRELGRFSVEYRKMFGESPSATLRQALREHARRGTKAYSG